MIVPYNVVDDGELYHKYYTNQAGFGFNVFKGTPVHTGNGIGSFFGKLARSAMPLVKKAAKSVFKTGVNIASDALRGEDVAQSAIHHGKRAGSDFLTSLTTPLDEAGDEFRSSNPPSRKKKRVKRKGRNANNGILDKVSVRQ